MGYSPLYGIYINRLNISIIFISMQAEAAGAALQGPGELGSAAAPERQHAGVHRRLTAFWTACRQRSCS